MAKPFLAILLLLLIIRGDCQVTEDDSLLHPNSIRFRYEALIIPATLITYGIIGLESHTIQALNSDNKSEINEHIDEKISIDDFSQYSPFLSVYALNAAGVHGINNFYDRTIILSTASLIMASTVYVLKSTGHELRPDQSSRNSFPSGHTATAFMGAEFLFQEYKHKSVWYGISGYLVAAGTGYFRMYNDRHWFTDIASGAGIGIVSTKIAYWTHPFIKKTIFRDKKNLQGMVMPLYDGNHYGLGMAINF